jgi:hypothetical protein
VLERFAVQMHEDQPRPGAVGETELNKLSGSGIPSGTCFNPKRGYALLTLPHSNIVSGIPIGEAGLTKDRVLKCDPICRTSLNFAAPKQPAPLHRRELDLVMIGHGLPPVSRML